MSERVKRVLWDLQTLICVLVARPRRCPILSNPVPWQNWVVVYRGYTLRMKRLFRGWPVMVHDKHMRRRMRQCDAFFRVTHCKMSVCPFIHPSQSDNMSKPRNIALSYHGHIVALSFYFLRIPKLCHNTNWITPNGVIKQCWGELKLALSDQSSVSHNWCKF